VHDEGIRMNNPALMNRRPWLQPTLHLPHDPVGMLGGREARLYYHLAKESFTGIGTIVDAGSFLGKSAYFLAEGLRANPHYDRSRDRIHCFDNFLVNEDATVRFVKENLRQELAVGDSTRALFDAQVAPVQSMIDVHAGDLHTAEWRHQPIEILLVDVAKSESLGQRVVEMFFPDLIPGESLVIQQDYHHPWLPHIHIVMEHLAEYFELVEPRADDSAVFRHVSAIPAEVLRRAIAYDFSEQEQLALMDAAVGRLRPEDRYYVELAHILLKGRLAYHPDLLSELDQLRERFAANARDYSRNPYFEDVSSYLKEVEGWRLKDAGDYAGALRFADDVTAYRRTGYSLLLRAYALSGLQRYEEAERDIRASLAAGPRVGYAHVELGHVLWRLQRLDEAEMALLNGLHDADATVAATQDYLELLYWIWSERKTLGHARDTMGSLLRERPTDPEVWALNGRLHRLNRDAEAAAESWRKASDLGLGPERLAEVQRQ
jgi:tetratricopeptide (TPR) repeat protein